MIRRWVLWTFGIGMLTCFLTMAQTAQETQAASFRTKNFEVTAQNPATAEKVAKRAEYLRENLAQFWLGKKLPNWSKRCKIRLQIGNVNPGGMTTFVFNNGEVYGWDSDMQGTEERICDSVLPHEITHMILATYFRVPVPRWADEGAATFVESIPEQKKYKDMLVKFLRSHRGIPMDQLVQMTEYPADPLPLYAQSFSLTEFLIRMRGPQFFILFVEQTMQENVSIAELVREHFGYASLRELQGDWVSWVADGSPEFLGSNFLHGSPKVESSQPTVLANRENVPATQDTSAREQAGGNATYADGKEGVQAKLPRPSPQQIPWNSTDLRAAKVTQ